MDPDALRESLATMAQVNLALLLGVVFDPMSRGTGRRAIGESARTAWRFIGNLFPVWRLVIITLSAAWAAATAPALATIDDGASIEAIEFAVDLHSLGSFLSFGLVVSLAVAAFTYIDAARGGEETSSQSN